MESILTSVKKLLGIPEECEEFDADIIMHINSALFTLCQLGIGPESPFVIFSQDETYADFLGDFESIYQPVKTYLYYKARLGFDPPSSTSVIACIEEMTKETEWRLRAMSEELEEKSTIDGEESDGCVCE